MTARALPDKAAPMASSASQFCQVSFGLEVSELIHSGPIAARMQRKYTLTPHHYKQNQVMLVTERSHISIEFIKSSGICAVE